MDLVLQPYRKYADFQGRARRAEFWRFLLFGLVVIFLLEVIVAVGESGHIPALQNGAAILVGLFVIGSFIPWLALRVRRLHDTNRTGFWIFIGVIPFIGSLVLFVFSVLEGTKGPNRFGPDPKEPSVAETFS